MNEQDKDTSAVSSENDASANADAQGIEQDHAEFPPKTGDIFQEFDSEDGDDFFEDDEYSDRLEELLDKAKVFGCMNFVQLDGFLHGIVCNDGRIFPSAFIPEILGKNVRDVLCDAEIQEAVELILEHYDALLDMVEGKDFYAMPVIGPSALDWADDPDDIGMEDENQDAFSEVFAGSQEEDTDDDLAALPTAEMEELTAATQRINDELVAEDGAWAKAFLQALSLDGGLERYVSKCPEEKLAVLSPVVMLAHNKLLAGETSSAFGKPLTPEVREWALRVLPSCVMEVHRILRSPPRKGKKISRNDPCSCGSGKKYKKCCLSKPLS